MTASTHPADTSNDGARIDTKRAAMQQAHDALSVACEFAKLYDTEHAAWVNEKCHEAIAALRAALAEQAQPVAIPEGYEPHELPADYTGKLWIEGQVRALARTSPVHQPVHGWTDADADAARLALELECLLTDGDMPTASVSRWWESAHEALRLHRERLDTTPPAPGQKGWDMERVELLRKIKSMGVQR